jgi:putative inorganic carbon (HCO3(-)) transporter
MFNKILEFSQNKFSYLYENSFFLQNLDRVILPLVCVVFLASTFMPSDAIGFFALVVMFMTALKLLCKNGERIEFKDFEVWIVAYFMIVVISLCGSTLFAQSLKGFFKTFVYIGFYFSVVQYLKSNKSHIKWLLLAIGAAAAGEIVIGFMQTFIHLEAISTWQDTSMLNPEDVISRVYGTLLPLNPNLFGGYLVACFPVILGSVFYFARKRHLKLTIITLCFSLLGVFTIFQTGCRGAYLALMLILGCVFLVSAKFFWKTYKKLYLSIIGAATGLFIAAIMFVNSLRLRFLSIFAMRADSSNSFRFNVYHSALEMFKDNWLLGIGVGNKNFREIYGLYMKTGFDALSAYNIYLETAVESGIFALVAFLGFLIILSKDAVKFIIESDDTEKLIYLSVSIIAIWALMFHGLVDTIFFRPQLQFVFWTYVAIISVILPSKAVSRISQNDQN